MYPISTNLTTLGSRYSFIFDTGAKRLKHGVLGMFLERSDELICGVEADEKGSYLPFSSLPNHFQAVYQNIDMNSVSFRAVNKDGGYNMDVTFTSPFCPSEEKMNTAPVFYVDVTLTRSTRPHNLVKVKKNIDSGTLRFGLRDDGLATSSHSRFCDFRYEVETDSRFVLGDFARTLHLKLFRDGEEVKTVSCQERLIGPEGSVNSNGIFEIPFTLTEGAFHTGFIFCGYCAIRDFISIYGRPHNLLYTSYFSDMDQLTEYACRYRNENMAKTCFVSKTITDSSLSQSWKDLIAFSFQSYKLNTVYSSDETGKKAYHVWEGNCMYASTMDVEYNNGLFYYTYFPEALPMLLDQWAVSENGEGYIDHDLGEAYVIARAKYSYPMIIEENCCYLLMLYACCSVQGSFEEARIRFDMVKRLARRILESDTTGNGIPDTGTDNTIDDAIPAIQNAKEQTYLAFKSACALQCYSRMADALGYPEESRQALSRSRQIIESVDRELWRGDHYGICTDTSQDGCRRFLTHEMLTGPMEGRDSYSIYAENGMLYPFLSGLTLRYFNYDRLSRDITEAFRACCTPFGCNHSNDSDSIWFSQNMWRDFTAAYLGHDMLDNADRYWDFQKIMNTGDHLNLYIDTFGENALWYYPRGLTSIGVLFAALRLKIDGFSKVIQIAPLRKTMRIPLVSFTDWKTLRTPWVNVENGKVLIENEDLLKDFKVVLSL